MKTSAKIRKSKSWAFLAGAVVITGGLSMGLPADAAVLIINGSSGTPEVGTTADITNTLNTLLQTAGNSTVIADAVPLDFTGFSQIWDIRFSNNLAITTAEQSGYLSFLQGGGGLFVMGENGNSNFLTRNSSILNLVAAAGGGSLSFVVPDNTQSVLSPFTGPNAVSTVVYASAGAVSSSGTGQFITRDGFGNGAGVAFQKGTLANAPKGVLTALFDANFMQGTFDQPASQNLLKNVIGFQTVQVATPELPPPAGAPAPVPTPALLPGLIGLGWGALRKRQAAVPKPMNDA